MVHSLYYPIYLIITSLICYMTVFLYWTSPGYYFQKSKTNMIVPLILCIILVFWLGNRPVSGKSFGDTVNYAIEYNSLGIDSNILINWSGEWIWALLMVVCKRIGLDIHGFLTVVEAGYVFSALWAVKRFMPTKPMLGMLFVFTSLMFFTFGVNGLRNGLACNVMLLALSYFFDDKYVAGGLLSLLAFGIHRSVILPIAGMLAGRFVIKDIRYSIGIWMASIFVSLVVGEPIMNIVASFGFDDRMASYITIQYDDSFSSSGFRWDFLLYSAFPIIMGWYVCVKRNIKDDWYQALCTTYCMCNAFWVLIIRVAFTNRFAYLSWFMYPIIIAYPLVNLPVWEDQDRKTAVILAIYCSFTLVMQLVYWGV